MAKNKNLEIADLAFMSEQDEEQTKLAIAHELDTVSGLTRRLNEERQQLALATRFKDIEHVKNIDEFIELILEALADAAKDKVAVRNTITQILREGKFKSLADLMTALGIALDKREMLLGFDPTRNSGSAKKKMKLQVLWKGTTGETAAIRVEANS